MASTGLMEGVLSKKELMNTVWKQRYFILQENGIMAYYENYNERLNGHHNKISNDIDLNDVKSVNCKKRELVFELITNSTNKKHILCAHDVASFNKWSSFINKRVYGKEIHRGYMLKLGEKRKAWKKRWFILYDTKKLMYHESKTLSIPKGIICLHDVIGYGYGTESQYNSRYVMELKTATRVWALKCSNDAQLSGWFEHILHVMNDKKESETERILENIVKSESKKIPKLFTANMPSAVSIDFTKSYNSYQNWRHGNDVKMLSVDPMHIVHKMKQKSVESLIPLSNEYKSIQNELMAGYKEIMKDCVINKEHTLVQDASTNYCFGNEFEYDSSAHRMTLSKKRESNKLFCAPLSPRTISAIPKRRESNSMSQSKTPLITDDYIDDDEDDLKLDLVYNLNDDDDDFESKSPKTQKQINRNIKTKLFEQCLCISRVILILKMYKKWIHFKADSHSQLNDNESFCGILSVLEDSKYTITDLLNDYHHIKRFHVEFSPKIDPQISIFFVSFVGECDITKCVAFKRNLNCIAKNRRDTKRWKEYFLSSLLCSSRDRSASQQRAIEVVTQQILDVIHCYVIHLSHCIRNNVGNNHKFVTLTKVESVEEEKEKEESRLFSAHNSHFGDILNRRRSRTKARSDCLRNEVLNCSDSISCEEWNEVNMKSQIYLNGFESLSIKCSTQFDDKYRVIRKNEFLSNEDVAALMLFCCASFNALRNELISSYHEEESKFNKFYHFGHILRVVIAAFGSKMYQHQSGNIYHCFQHPVLFQNLRCEFNAGPISLTCIPSIVLTKMYIDKFRSGIIVEMDVNSCGSIEFFDASLFSTAPYEMERILYGKSSFCIKNIIESDITQKRAKSKSKKFCYHSNYLDAITLLRMIIGHETLHAKYSQNSILCDRLSLLISLEINSRRKRSRCSKKKLEKQLVPQYIAKLFHSLCMNVCGVIVLKLNDIIKLSKTRLQSYFLHRDRNSNLISLSFRILFQLFPASTKILCYGILFNRYLCQTFVSFLKNQINDESQINEIIFMQSTNYDDDDNNNNDNDDETDLIIRNYTNLFKEKQIEWQIIHETPLTNNDIDLLHDDDSDDEDVIPKISFKKKSTKQHCAL